MSRSPIQHPDEGEEPLIRRDEDVAIPKDPVQSLADQIAANLEQHLSGAELGQ